MTWAHPPTQLLTAFAMGALDESEEDEAVRVALHLDDCPACAAQAASLDPMAYVFASVDAPDVPTDLAAAVMVAAEAPTASVALPPWMMPANISRPR